ncbi:MAG: type II toxin-antitoxin system RelE/ParE family toxin [Planctomycetia bacterium]|nr:type II toxin-antitoxin system RelE/ParE family toxin [Planctomycetia bacterium]
MSLPVNLTDEALFDLQQAYEWYNTKRDGLGVTFVTRTKAKLLAIGDSPESCALLWGNVRATTIRRFPYIVYYRILVDRVEVLAILHGSRDVSEWQRRV